MIKHQSLLLPEWFPFISMFWHENKHNKFMVFLEPFHIKCNTAGQASFDSNDISYIWLSGGKRPQRDTQTNNIIENCFTLKEKQKCFV